MVTIVYYAELAIATVRLFLIFIGILISIEIMSKSSGKLRNSAIFFLIGFIPSTLYTIGRVLNIEAYFTSGKFISMTLNLSTTLFILMGLFSINKLLDSLSTNQPNKRVAKGKTVPKKMTYRKANRKLIKTISISNIIKRG